MTSLIQRQLTSLSRIGISRNYSIRPGFFTALGHTSPSNSSIPVIARASPYSSPSGSHSIWRGTTILSVRKGDQVSVVGDGQITMGSQVVKPNARKVRRLGADNKVIAGFAGATADALTLFERLETKIDEHPEQLLRACVSLAKEWRMDKYLRRLDAMLLVCDADMSLYLTGTGDVIEPPDGIIGIGSGSSFAIAAARALIPFENLTAEEIAKRSMDIAADLCIYTNSSFITEVINGSSESESDEDAKSEPDASSGK